MFFFALITLSAFATALPVYLRDVFVPPVTYPHAGTVWQVGQTHNVTWYCFIVWHVFLQCLTSLHRDISGAPAQITNPTGIIVLAHNGLLDLSELCPS